MLQTKLEWDREVEIEIKEGEEMHNPDPYDFVYSNIPKKTRAQNRRKLQILPCKKIQV